MKTTLKTMKIPQNARLAAMLQTKRPHDSISEEVWVSQFILPYKPIVFGDKAVAAYAITVGDPEEPSNVLFSSHVDTMHSTGGVQIPMYDKYTGIYTKMDGVPLGADDTAGVWLMLEMIDAGVPGTYLFHRGEEQGCIGSCWMANHMENWLKTFDCAIAFDRKALDSIITHQRFGRCCSDVFGQALADQLNSHTEANLMYSLDDTGIYTDTAEYMHIIAECTNVSVGYYDEHTARERLDWPHLRALRDACLTADWKALPIVRDPTYVEPKVSFKGWGSSYKTCSSHGKMLDMMSRSEMDDMAYCDPETFVDLVRAHLFGENAEGDVDDDDDWNKQIKAQWTEQDVQEEIRRAGTLEEEELDRQFMERVRNLN